MPTFIRTANDQPSVRAAGGYRRFIAKLVAQRWRRQLPNWDVRGAVSAEIVRSSWRVSCPFCASATVAEPGEPFFCPDCMMAGNNGLAMLVIMPEEREQIERILNMRPVPETRNWLPHESVDDLIVENIEHGDPFPQEPN